MTPEKTYTREQIEAHLANVLATPCDQRDRAGVNIIRQLQSDLASVCKTLENYEDILEKEKADHCDALEQLASVGAECLP